VLVVRELEIAVSVLCILLIVDGVIKVRNASPYLTSEEVSEDAKQSHFALVLLILIVVPVLRVQIANGVRRKVVV
jgi:hypothetical protein